MCLDWSVGQSLTVNRVLIGRLVKIGFNLCPDWSVS